jgi:virginiamycin B lyase
MKLGMVVATAVLASTFLWAAQASASVYWTNFQSGGTTLGAANLDGTVPNQSFVTSASEPLGVTVDGQYIYWTTLGDTIGRANLDGSGTPNSSFITTASAAEGIAVNGQYIYWTTLGGAIGRANLDGTAPNQNFITGANTPTGLAVNAQHIYWSNFGSNTIGRANLDGTNANESFVTDATFPGGVAVNAQHIYWTNEGGTIGRANLDGTAPNQSLITGANTPRAVVVDSHYIYWANLGTNKIGRANLDGTTPNESFITTANNPFGVAVDGGPAGAATASAPSLTFASQPLDTYSTPQALTVTNTGHGILQIAKAQVTAGDTDDFLITTDTCSGATLWPGEACTVDVRFGPTAPSARSATLTLTSNDPTSPLLIALGGTGGQLPQGPAGSPGFPGPVGPTGATGAQGPAGKDGQVELLTCKPVTSTITKKVHGKPKKTKVTKQKCTTKILAGPLTFTTSSTNASLSRAGITYATGTAIQAGRHPQLLLQPGRVLSPGSYRLRVTRGDGRTSSYAVELP